MMAGMNAGLHLCLTSRWTFFHRGFLTACKGTQNKTLSQKSKVKRKKMKNKGEEKESQGKLCVHSSRAPITKNGTGNGTSLCCVTCWVLHLLPAQILTEKLRFGFNFLIEKPNQVCVEQTSCSEEVQYSWCEDQMGF